MLKPHIQTQPHVNAPCLSLQRPTNFNFKKEIRSPLFRHVPTDGGSGKRAKAGQIQAVTGKSQAVSSSTEDITTISVQAVVTVKSSDGGGLLSQLEASRAVDEVTDLLGKSILLELVSAELDPHTGLEKETIKGFASKGDEKDGAVTYKGNFQVYPGFGEIGGVLVTNEHHEEMYFKDIILTGFPDSPVNITCNSWVHSKNDNPDKRIFFTKLYLPSETPAGLRTLRNKELENLRGNGQGERKSFDRIYDYDVYNDLGSPDLSDDLARPVLGGKVHSYPRRCRTGRPPAKKDPTTESRSLESPYVPRDEAFSSIKSSQFSATTLKSVLHAVTPSLESVLEDPTIGFPFFSSIDSMYTEGITLKKAKSGGLLNSLLLTRVIKKVQQDAEEVLLFDSPEMMDRDKFSWLSDEEFARQTLAGTNPFSIQLVTEFPLVSKLDPKVYGPKESAITKELIEREIKGVMTVEEALEHKKLFMLDYHDLLLPYVHKVRKLEGTTLYGSRTLFFLTEAGTLKPIAIELTRPASPLEPQWKRVFVPSSDPTDCWTWRLAKAHVGAHDSSYHELIIHWLRTHCSTEPYIIASNRQLSAMHPIYVLMKPYFRYTMEINALARQYLINGGGIIEISFSPLKYSIELSSAAYEQWRFDHQGLPADLVSRGMAVEDPTADGGVKLVIDDYPFASDGLLIWSSLKQWVSDYVAHYYPEPSTVLSDLELQSWWTEIKTKGHADKKDEPWWPPLQTPADLAHILTTIIWVASAHHAATNFGQYAYGGYFPNRPSIARKEMPMEDESSEEFHRFLRKPENAMLNTFPTQIQATLVMAILNVLSTHSPDEEYLGGEPEPEWIRNPTIKSAFDRFSGKMKEIEGVIDRRNANLSLKNRTGAGVVPYELLKPFSKPGVTGMGVPNSISI